MVAVASCLAQMLALIDCTAFARAVRHHQAERGAKGFSCWEQFVSMLFCQVGSAHSLREICGGLATALGKLVHLGVRRTPTRSTLAYANAHRPWQLYESVFYDLLHRCQGPAATKRRRFRFKHPLRTLDSTIIELCATVFDWARFVRTKGGHQAPSPTGSPRLFALLGARHRRRRQRCPRGVAADVCAGHHRRDGSRLPGLCPVSSLDHGRGVVCQTPADQYAYDVLDRRPVPTRSSVLADEVIRLTGPHAADRCPVPLRQVTIWDETQQRALTFLTNLMHLAASTIAAIYKERWQIELLFKALKQHLRIKTFVGTSENAVQVRIWIALIAMLLLKFPQLKSTWPWSLSNLAALLRFNLLTYRDLWAWLNAPFGRPGITPMSMQATLFAT